jgi:hypothetical protein
MHVFWWQHGLHLQPDNQEEANQLVRLVEGIKFGRPDELAIEPILKLVVADAEDVPRGVTPGNLNNKKGIV